MLTTGKNVAALQNSTISLNTIKNTSWATVPGLTGLSMCCSTVLTQRMPLVPWLIKWQRRNPIIVATLCDGGSQTWWQAIPHKFPLSIVLLSFKIRSDNSSKLEHLYRCRIHWLSKNLVEEWGNWQHQVSSTTQFTGGRGTIVDYWTAWNAYSPIPLGLHILLHWCLFWVTRWAITPPARMESTTDYGSGSEWREEASTLCRRYLWEQL